MKNPIRPLVSRYVKEWVVVDNGLGINYDIHVNSIDTNGVINLFY